MEETIEKVKEEIARADRVAVLTGAGISAESGVPTFRGADGLWKNYQATDLATPQAFSRDPKLVWEFYNWRRDLISRVTFNAAHQALASLEAHARVVVVTQNVDGYHQEAGSSDVLEFHGTIWKVRCLPSSKRAWPGSVPLPSISPVTARSSSFRDPLHAPFWKRAAASIFTPAALPSVRWSVRSWRTRSCFWRRHRTHRRPSASMCVPHSHATWQNGLSMPWPSSQKATRAY